MRKTQFRNIGRHLKFAQNYTVIGGMESDVQIYPAVVDYQKGYRDTIFRKTQICFSNYKI
jgi:hypothetical protein